MLQINPKEHGISDTQKGCCNQMSGGALKARACCRDLPVVGLGHSAPSSQTLGMQTGRALTLQTRGSQACLLSAPTEQLLAQYVRLCYLHQGKLPGSRLSGTPDYYAVAASCVFVTSNPFSHHRSHALPVFSPSLVQDNEACNEQLLHQ